jgi:amidohydrolase
MSVRDKVQRMVQGVASGAGATAVVTVASVMPPITNSPALAALMRSTLNDLNVAPAAPSTTSDDAAILMEGIPGLYFFLGGTPAGVDPGSTAANHSPHFFVDEGAVLAGIRLMSRLAFDYVNHGT